MQVGQGAQYRRQELERGVGERLVAEIDLQEHGVRLALLRKAYEHRRIGRRRGRYLGARPMAGDMMGEPLQAFGVAAHHQ